MNIEDINCKDCKWWIKNEINNIGICESTNNVHSGMELTLFAQDDYGVETVLMTKPDFGCKNFERKSN